MDGAKVCTMAYQTLFSGFGIHHGNTVIHITHAQFMKGSFMLVFDVTPVSYDSDGHTIVPYNGSNYFELKFDEAQHVAVTILHYHEFDASIHIDRLRNITTEF
jgi:hypothetical protein